MIIIPLMFIVTDFTALKARAGKGVAN